MAIETSIVVDFGDDESSRTDTDVVVIELDEFHEANHDEEGEVKSSFYPGDRPVILIHHANTVVIDTVKCTHGSMQSLASNLVREKETRFLATSEKSDSSLSYANIGSFTSQIWYGNSAVVAINSSEITTTSGTYPALGDLFFNVPFQQQWQLVPPALTLEEDETYEIRIVVYASLKETI